MSPLISEGDRIFADESAQSRADLHDGDVIVFRRPENGIAVKRVLALPGEAIEGKDRKLIRNGRQLDEPYLARPPKTQNLPPLTDFAGRTVPPGDIFVAGDNRDLSYDSRFDSYGPVHLTDVLGKYTLTYWHARRK